LGLVTGESILASVGLDSSTFFVSVGEDFS